ncbi:14316_t:CDS:2 [Entrophospora sp. SA101]|nr:14316_t:CDS:2 [Entrophospora sp. SA101]
MTIPNMYPKQGNILELPCQSQDNYRRRRRHQYSTPYSPYSSSLIQNNFPSHEIIELIINTNIPTHTRTTIQNMLSMDIHELIKPANKSRKKIPRAVNPFVIFRKNLNARRANERGPDESPKLKIVSNEAGTLWRSCSEFEKHLYESLATCAKEVHRIMYPGYSYKPNRKPKGQNKNSNTTRNNHQKHEHFL